ncbi:ABC transporter ATP-binding protein [Helcococcus ovis]|uniref:ABC transporter ATP-binding protein n=1 Tax=Helcococcus ovis TaxID=72026 RepID=UPI0038BBCFF4
MKILELKNLTKAYGKKRGVKNLNLTINEGEIVGFVGPNGAGKSTTMRTILGFQTVTSGSIELFGKEHGLLKDKNLANIGYMPSEAMFYPDMRVKEIIQYSQDLRNMNCTVEANKLVKRLNLDVNKKINELSLGNKKKVSIVCAFQHNPKFYILDEPTSGLDPLIQQEFFKLIKEKNENGATVLLSSHVLSEVQNYAHKVVFIKEGEILKIGSINEILQNRTKKVKITGLKQSIKFDGISDIREYDNEIVFTFNGDPQYLIRKLNNYDFENINIDDPDLEEIFSIYYGG